MLNSDMHSKPHSYDIAIVGAGICGLTAAIELSEKSDARIIILEGDTVAGGRAKSVALDNGTVLNTGANWFHGGDDNAFYQWAKNRYDLGELVLDDVEGRIALWAGKDDAKITEAFDALQSAYEHFTSVQPDKDISLHDLAASTGSADIVQAADFMATEWMAVNSAKDISCNEYFNDPLGPGGWQMKDGVHRLIKQMVKDAEKNGVEIRYGAKVKSIEGENIILSNGETLSAAQCLVTVSAGILKNRMIAFDAPVQDEVALRTEGLIMGNLVKIIVPVREGYFKTVQMKSDVPVYMIDQSFFVHAQTAGKSTITIFKGGDKSHAIELWDEGKTENFVADVLSKIPQLNGYDAFRDGSTLSTSWQSNPLAMGSYSVCKPHHKRSDPFNVGNIHFAGESFIADPANSPGQMKGAWQSGQMAAKNILKLL